MWQPKHTEFRHKDFYTARTTKEVYGIYVVFDDPTPWYKREKFIVVCVFATAVLLAFSIIKGVV